MYKYFEREYIESEKFAKMIHQTLFSLVARC